MKIGLECEGEFDTVESLFMSAAEFMSCDDINGWTVKQVYISDHNNELDLYDSRLYKLYARGLRVVVEVTEFKEAPYYVNIMLLINNDSFWNLRANDHVKFSRDLNVYAIKKKSMPYTDPSNFAGDVLL